ncbi:fibronectin type III domain-containing protein [Paradonghicola geojensis]|nr:fibronectin type III domain-containing protein [Marivivens geojensis]
MSAGLTATGTVSDFAEGDVLTISFNNGNASNIVKITSLGSSNVTQWPGVAPLSISYTVVASDVGSGISYELYGGANNTWAANFSCVAAIVAPNAPTSLVATSGDGQALITFIAPSDTGGSTISNYEYSLDNGVNWTALNPVDTSSPITIAGLTNGTNYSIKIRAVNSAGGGTASSSVTATPVGVSTAPTSLVATAGDGQVSVAFTAPSDNGGSAITDYEYQLDDGPWVSASTTSSPIVITGLNNGTSYSIKLRAVNAGGNGAASLSVQVTTPSPQSTFDEVKDEVVSQVQAVALQNLRNSVQETTNFMFSARDRFIASRRMDETSMLSSRNNVPFDIEGSTSVSTSSANIDGSFFGQFGDFDGTYRRITSGDFNLQRDEGGNTTAALSGRIAWEYLTSDTAMLGWFVGAEYVQSDLNGTFSGDQTSFGASIGGYFVSELQDQLYLDGHLTLKQNEHDLMLSNGMLELESIYHSTTVLGGLTLTGVSTIDESSELWPTLSINAAQSDLGAIGFTGTAYGLTDNSLSMDGGVVSYADVSVAPKYRVAMDGQSLANSLLVASVTPKVMCEYTELGSTTSRNCGSGLMLGLLGTTKEGNGTLELELGLDSIGGATRHSVALSADLKY